MLLVLAMLATPLTSEFESGVGGNKGEGVGEKLGDDEVEATDQPAKV